jgi:uncharacterized protein
VTVNGTHVDTAPNPRGYVELNRVWAVGDIVVLTLPIEPRFTVSHPAADALRGTVAIERGPIVYAFESPDQADGVDLNHIEVLVNQPLVSEIRENFLGQRVAIVKAAGLARDDAAWSRTGWMPLANAPRASGQEVELVAIPYALWANRGPSVMRIHAPANR